jgi:hypothetical protein
MISVTEFIENGGELAKVSLSSPDHLLQTHNPEEFEQGFVARNPKNHDDLWYVAKKYFDDNLEEAEPPTATNETPLDRLIKERDSLQLRFTETENILDNSIDAIKKGDIQLNLMANQHSHMRYYLFILNLRINNLLGIKSDYKEEDATTFKSFIDSNNFLSIGVE